MIYEVAELKKELSILFILERIGHEGNPCLCPFHDDESPSLDVFGENLERWGCFPCGRSGDVLDLVSNIHPNLSFIEVKDRAGEYLEEQIRSGWDGPRTGPKKEYNASFAENLVTSGLGTGAAWNDLHRDLSETKPGLASTDPEQIRVDFRLATSGSQTVIPYFDRDNSLVAYKTRMPGSKNIAAEGASFNGMLYAEWLDDGEKPVLICEGESDVWAATYALPEFTVLGLSTGTGTNPSQASTLAERDVILAFDGDDAGRIALRTWFDALQPHANSVMIAPVPEDYDLAELEDIASVVNNAIPVLSVLPNLDVEENAIYRVNANGDRRPISTFGLRPERAFRGSEGTTWKVRIPASGKVVPLAPHDLHTDTTFGKWAVRNNVTWNGRTEDVRNIQAWLHSETPFLPIGHFSEVAGLHSSHFIWPGGVVGPDDWHYIPGTGVSLTEDKFFIHRGECDFADTLRVMRSLRGTDIMDPILSWFAVAPLRSLFSAFPTLTVMGGSGTGKTTLVETILKKFSGSLINTNMLSTTEYAALTLAGASNAFPVWFDEYRPGSSQNAKRAVDQLIRDAYNGANSMKGGAKENWAQLTEFQATAPLIVSGEDAFTETSHIDRSVPVWLSPNDKNGDALAAINAMPPGFAYDWLEYLRTENTVSLTPIPYDIDLPDRIRYNLGLLQIGWDLLQSRAPFDMGTPDYSGIIRAWVEDSNTNPITEAMEWVKEQRDADCFMNRPEGTHVRVRDFVNYATKHGDFTMPGGERAVRRYLETHLGAEHSRVLYGGIRIRTMLLKSDALD